MVMGNQVKNQGVNNSFSNVYLVVLTRGGVKVYFDSPSTVTHVKAVVIDGRYVYIGSHNLTQSALRHNNELSVLIDSPEMASEITSYMGKL